jgi:hypothetical protein
VVLEHISSVSFTYGQFQWAVLQSAMVRRETMCIIHETVRIGPALCSAFISITYLIFSDMPLNFSSSVDGGNDNDNACVDINSTDTSVLSILVPIPPALTFTSTNTTCSTGGICVSKGERHKSVDHLVSLAYVET